MKDGSSKLAEGLGLEPRRASLPFTGFQDRLLANSDTPPYGFSIHFAPCM